jgi:nitrate reductase NapAB chaperone NapD
VEVKDFTLKALDWARKLAEGMPSSSVVAVTGEQETKAMAKELSQVTPEEFKAENPNGHALLVVEATKDKDTIIGEMTAKVDEGEKAKTLLQTVCDAIGVDSPDKLLAKVTELKETVGGKAKATLDTALDRLLEEKVPDAEKRAVVRALLPIGEMTAKVEGLSESDDHAKIIGDMVDDAFNKTDTIKTVVGEMAPPVVRRRDELRTGDNLDAALDTYGVKRERVTLGS